LIRIRLNASGLVPAVYLVKVVNQSDVTFIVEFRGGINPFRDHVLSFFFREGIRVGIVAVGASCGLQVDLINLPQAWRMLDSSDLSGSRS
jgi:hypothetical protein